jgi:hypothetical protein
VILVGPDIEHGTLVGKYRIDGGAVNVRQQGQHLRIQIAWLRQTYRARLRSVDRLSETTIVYNNMGGVQQRSFGQPRYRTLSAIGGKVLSN